MKDFQPQKLSGWDEFWNEMSPKRRKAFDEIVKSLAEEIGRAYGPTLRDVQVALDKHTSAVEVILNMKQSDRGAAITSLANLTTQWLQQRDARWRDLGANLGKKVQKGLESAFGI